MCGGSKSSQSTQTTNQDNRVTSGDGSYIVDASGGSNFTLNDVSPELVMESIAQTGVNLDNFLDAAGSLVDRAFDENSSYLAGAVDLAELSQGQSNEVLEASETLALKAFEQADNFNEGSIELSGDVLDASDGLLQGGLALVDKLLSAGQDLVNEGLSFSAQSATDNMQFTRDVAQDTATPGRETMTNIFYAAAAMVAAVMIFGGGK
tara:strand:- start:71 stop:691 length:621 start_codon:yes stop_codon:yes gene_type:complete